MNKDKEEELEEANEVIYKNLNESLNILNEELKNKEKQVIELQNRKMKLIETISELAIQSALKLLNKNKNSF
jgi:hypothetical protein